MKPSIRQSIRKHNGFMALFLSMVIMISGGLQLVHDQLLDHQHDSDCAMYVVDGNTPVASASSDCSVIKQDHTASSYAPVALLVTEFTQYAPRAPPITL